MGYEGEINVSLYIVWMASAAGHRTVHRLRRHFRKRYLNHCLLAHDFLFRPLLVDSDGCAVPPAVLCAF